ncbi:MAG: glycosyltransferase family 4 protein, partial [Clostridia bacterium]|nr:glycosyltransferase family 4 protein [Clostridia bacterium]
ALEAMACGLPLITSNSGAIKDYSINGKTGFVCDADNEDQFAIAINNLFENPEQCKKMGRINQEIAQKYDITLAREKMIKIFIFL